MHNSPYYMYEVLLIEPHMHVSEPYFILNATRRVGGLHN